MRRLIFSIAFIFIAAVIVGCSGSSNISDPLTPMPDQIASADSNSETLYNGTFEIDLGSMSIAQYDRQIEYVYNITGFLPDKCPGGCFRFRIVGIVGTVLEIELTVENPTLYQVYDLRLQYNALYGKTVLNPDSYTDFLSAPITGIHPFTAFMKEDPNRAFPVGPGGIDTETLFLDFPAGAQASVDYAITASLPGNCHEPFEISDMTQTGQLSPGGGSASISCRVKDHQDNVSAVYVDTTPITGSPKAMIQDVIDPEMFAVTISNTSGAPVGTYIQLMMALSSNPQNISTYNYVEITVSDVSSDPIAIISEPCDGVSILAGTSVAFDGSLSYDEEQAISEYAWDWDWDGDPLNFTVDSLLVRAIHRFDTPGIFTVGLRVMDTSGWFGYDSVTVNVEPQGSRSWSAEEIVTSWSGVESIERNYDPSHQIVVDCDGIVHMIFKFRSNGGPTSGIYYVNYDGTTFSEPEHLGANMDAGLYQPTLRIDNNGDLHCTYLFISDINYLKRTGGVWSPNEIIASSSDFPGYAIEYPSMAVNYLGDVMVIFAKTNSGYDWELAAMTNNGSGWSEAETIGDLYLRVSGSSTQIPNQDLQAATDGGFHLVYKSWPTSSSVSDYNLYHMKYLDGGWSSPYLFADLPGQNIALGSFVDPSGDLYAVWQTSQYGTFNGMFQRFDSQTETWGSPIRATQNPLSGDYSWIPDVTVNADGNVMYVWEYYDGTWRHVYWKTFIKTANATTILNATENNLISGAWDKSNPNLFMEQNGKVHLILEDDRSDPGVYWARDLYYTVWE